VARPPTIGAATRFMTSAPVPIDHMIGRGPIMAAVHDDIEPTEGERIDAMEFVARVLVQIPDPRGHLVRRAALRRRWAELIRRVYEVDAIIRPQAFTRPWALTSPWGPAPVRFPRRRGARPGASARPQPYSARASSRAPRKGSPYPSVRPRAERHVARAEAGRRLRLWPPRWPSRPTAAPADSARVNCGEKGLSDRRRRGPTGPGSDEAPPRRRASLRP
jgi:hypothetical protein